MDYKLGKTAATYNPAYPQFTEFRNSEAPVVVPSVYGHGHSFIDWGMLGNDEVGDCVIAGGGHEHMLWGNLANGGVKGEEVYRFDTTHSLQDYAAITGFNPITKEGDNGTNVNEANQFRLKTGYADATGKRHKIQYVIALEPGNLQHLREALYIFEIVGIGIEFPGSAMEQTNNGQVWSVTPGATIEGGHYIPLVGKPSEGDLACVTWGKRQVMTEQFYTKYCDEAYVYLTEEEINRKTQNNWGGFAWQDLKERLHP